MEKAVDSFNTEAAENLQKLKDARDVFLRFSKEKEKLFYPN
jgi:hypothetical protein